MSAPILSTSNNLTFEPEEEIVFADGTSAEFEQIGIRSLRIRPQRAKSGDLWAVVTATFVIDNVLAGNEEKIHPLCDTDNAFGEAYQNEVIKRIETERWIPWNRVPALQPLMVQLQEADYEVEATRYSYEEIAKWFDDNPDKTTMDPESTWMEFSVARNAEPLAAEFVASVGDMQQETTTSVYAGLTQVKALIEAFTKKVQSKGGVTREENSNFRALVGNVMGFHETNDGNEWGNKLALVALTINGEEYSLFFDRNKEKVSDVRSLFAGSDTSPETESDTVTETDGGVDIAALLSGSDE